MATTMAVDEDDNVFDGDGATGNDDGDGMTGNDNDDNDDGDSVMGDGVTGYDNNDDGDGQRRRRWRWRNGQRSG